jgi:hypothetical protein
LQTSSDDSDDDVKMAKIRLIDHPDPKIKEEAINDIKKLLEGYKNEPLKNTDKRLIKGLYIKRPKDSDI